MVLNKINIDRLKEKAVIVYLTASPKAILKRTLHDDEERPLLKVADPTQTIRELLRFRQPFYKRAADVTINTSRLSIETTVTQIITRLREYEGFHF